jgi:hypothetical protein
MRRWIRKQLLKISWLEDWLIRRSEERELKLLAAQFAPKFEAAKKARDEEQEQAVYSEYSHQRDWIRDPTYGRIAEKLVAKARKYGIRVPDKSADPENESWERSNATGDWMLVPDAEQKLRIEIRAEQRGRNDEIRKWTSLAFLIVGTAFGLWSLMAKRKQPDPCLVNYYRNDAGSCVSVPQTQRDSIKN